MWVILPIRQPDTGEQALQICEMLIRSGALDIVVKQPVTKPEVDFVRGVDSGYAMNKLLEKGIIDVVGRSESLGRPLLYGTTHFFLEQFGLKDLEELPDLREIAEILDDPAFNKERARLLELEREEELATVENGTIRHDTRACPFDGKRAFPRGKP